MWEIRIANFYLYIGETVAELEQASCVFGSTAISSKSHVRVDYWRSIACEKLGMFVF